MVDTLDIAKKLRADGVFTPEQAEGIASATMQAAGNKELSQIDARGRANTWIMLILLAALLALLWQYRTASSRLAAFEERLAGLQRETDRRVTDAERRFSTIESKLDQLLARP